MPPVAALTSRLAARLFALALLLGVAPSARAESSCEDEHVRAQQARADGKLVEARGALLACSAATCPNLVQADCVAWLAEVKSETPTVVLDAKDDRGGAVKVDSVRLDGRELPGGLDGKPLEVDTGEHEVVFHAAGLPPVTVRFLAKAGAKNERVTATFAAAPSSKRGSKIPAFVLFGVAGASLLGFGALAIAGQVEYDGFDSCKPRCDPDDVDRVQAEFIAADVLAGVSAAALATGLILYFTLPSGPSEAPKAARVVVSPARGGGVVGMGLSF